MTSRLRFQTLAPPIITLFVFALVVGVSMAILAFRFTKLQGQIAATTSASRSLIEISTLRATTKETLLRYRLEPEPKYKLDIDALEYHRGIESRKLRDQVQLVESKTSILEPFFLGSSETLALRYLIREAIGRGDFARADRLNLNYSVLYQINTARLKDLHAFLQTRLNSAEQNLKQLLMMVSILVTVMFILAAFLSWWMSRFYRDRVLLPLTSLHRGLRTIADGALGERLEVKKAPLEIQEMIHDFNNMTARLDKAKKDSTEAREQALRAARIKSDFLSNMSHEIRTPLNVIVGVSDELTRRDLEPQVKREVLTLHKSGRMLLNIIGDILDFSRLESGKVILANETCNLHELLKRVNDVLESLAKAKGLTLSLHIAPVVPKEIFCDAQRLERALMNLVGNAIKFTRKGFVKIICSVQGQNAEGDPMLVIQVSDSGVGIPREKMGDLFSRFVQADSSVTRKFGGTGLGLAIVKQIAVLMKGDIQVESKPDVGSVFTLSIPILSAPKAAAPELRARYQPAIIEDSLKDIRILSVDDSPDNQFLIRTYLNGTGAILSEAGNGREAIDIATSNEFDVILMDIQMPEVDGHQATKQIRKFEKENDRKHTIIIALTAFALQHEVQLSQDSGCDHHLTKPILKAKLIDTIRGMIAKKRMVPVSANSQPEAL